MPLLTDAVAAVLRSDPVSALAAMFIIGRYHPELMLWAARAMGDAPAEVEPPSSKPNSAAGRRRNGDGRRHRKPRSDDRRLARRDADDEQLIEAMKANRARASAILRRRLGGAGAPRWRR